MRHLPGENRHPPGEVRLRESFAPHAASGSLTRNVEPRRQNEVPGDSPAGGRRQKGRPRMLFYGVLCLALSERPAAASVMGSRSCCY
jgi:hypothetical protein